MAADASFNVNGHTYRANRLSAFQALDIATRMALPAMAIADLKKNRPNAKQMQIMQAFVATLSQVNSAAMNEAMDVCMSVVSRKQGAVWAAIRSGNQTLMFDDITLPEMVEIAWRVMEANRIPDFFAEVPDAEAEQKTGD